MSNHTDPETRDTDPAPEAPPPSVPPSDDFALRPLATWLSSPIAGARRHVEVIHVKEGAQFCVMLHEAHWERDIAGEGWGATIAEAAADALNDVMRRAGGRP